MNKFAWYSFKNGANLDAILWGDDKITIRMEHRGQRLWIDIAASDEMLQRLARAILEHKNE